jgi:hypothetical protein
MFPPKYNRAADFLGGFARTYLPNPGAIFRQERHQFREIDISGKGRLMVMGRPNAILYVTANRPRTNLPQPFFMIDERKIFLDLKMTEVVPVTDLRRVELIQ